MAEEELPGVGVRPEELKPQKKKEGPKGKKESRVIGFFKRAKKETTRKRLKCEKCGRFYGKEYKKGDTCSECGGKIKEATVKSPFGDLILFPVYLLSFMGSIFYFFNQLILAFFPFPELIPVVWLAILLPGIYFAWKLMRMGFLKGIILTIILVVGLGIGSSLLYSTVIPTISPDGEIPGIGGTDISCFLTKLFSADFQGLQGCYITTEKVEPPPYTGTKSYETLKVNLGTKFGGVYVLSSIYANEQYYFDISVLNSNSENKIFNVKIEDVEVFKNKNTTDCDSYDSMDNLCPFKTFFDDCTESSPCNIRPEDEKVVSVDLGTIPCKIDSRTLRYLEFDFKYTHEQNVTHKKTLGVAASYDDMEIFETDANLRKDVYETEVPSDGPVDLLIDFDSPYYLGKRSDNKVRMYVWVENKGGGKLKQLEEIVIEPIGKFPDWLTLTPSTKCERDGDVIKLGKLGEGFFKISKPYKYTCNLQINLDNYPGYTEGSPAAFQTIKFQGVLKYEYMETKSTDALKVDRSDC